MESLRAFRRAQIWREQGQDVENDHAYSYTPWLYETFGAHLHI